MDNINKSEEIKINIRRKKVRTPLKRAARNVRAYGSEYCNNTSIHGLKYLAEERSLFEKIWWLVIVITSMTACIVVIHKTYKKWQSSPVIVTFGTNETPLYEIPYPAITICPVTKISQRMYNYTKLYNMIQDNITLSEEDLKIYRLSSMFCNEDLGLTIREDINDNSTLNIPEFLDFVKNATPNVFTNSLHLCKYLNDLSHCSEIFTPIILDEGVCYTFNMLDRTEIFTDIVQHYGDYHNINQTSIDCDHEKLQYHGNMHLFAYPRRALLTGAKISLSVMLVALEEDFDYICRESLQAHKILLHHPANLPRLSNHYFTLSLDQSVIATVEPVMITTSDNLQSYRPSTRGCYYSTERKLKYFKIYTEDNCEMECVTNFTERVCGCVSIYMPRDNTTEICGFGDRECSEAAEVFLTTAGVMSKFSDQIDKLEFVKNFTKIDCHCLPACTSVNYKIELSQNDWNWKKIFEVHRINITDHEPHLNVNSAHFSRFELFFKTNQIIGLERHELYGPTDFLANSGGLLGLFTGFSLISLSELIYYLTLRLICNYKYYGKIWRQNQIKEN